MGPRDQGQDICTCGLSDEDRYPRARHTVHAIPLQRRTVIYGYTCAGSTTLEPSVSDTTSTHNPCIGYERAGQSKVRILRTEEAFGLGFESYKVRSSHAELSSWVPRSGAAECGSAKVCILRWRKTGLVVVRCGLFKVAEKRDTK